MALITGGTRGLGLATGRVFARQGYSLILTYRSDRENAERVAKEFSERGTVCHTLASDLSEENGSDVLFEQVQKLTSQVAVYVHNAAATVFKPLIDLKPHHIQKTYCITVTSFIRHVQKLVPMMPEGGAIISVSGMDTREAVPFHGLLASAKAALEMLTSYFAHELSHKNIRVNGINPGYLDTDSMEKYLGPLREKAISYLKKVVPSHELARLEDVASVIEFLASERARWIVGQTIVVDGGQTFFSPTSFAMEKS